MSPRMANLLAVAIFVLAVGWLLAAVAGGPHRVAGLQTHGRLDAQLLAALAGKVADHGYECTGLPMGWALVPAAYTARHGVMHALVLCPGNRRKYGVFMDAARMEIKELL